MDAGCDNISFAFASLRLSAFGWNNIRHLNGNVWCMGMSMGWPVWHGPKEATKEIC